MYKEKKSVTEGVSEDKKTNSSLFKAVTAAIYLTIVTYRYLKWMTAMTQGAGRRT